MPTSLIDKARRGTGLRPTACRIVLGIALALFTISIAACAGDSNEICDKIYGDCAGALVDDQGRSISREACVRHFDRLMTDQSEVVAEAAECVKKTTCAELSICFKGQTATP